MLSAKPLKSNVRVMLECFQVCAAKLLKSNVGVCRSGVCVSPPTPLGGTPTAASAAAGALEGGLK